MVTQNEPPAPTKCCEVFGVWEVCADSAVGPDEPLRFEFVGVGENLFIVEHRAVSDENWCALQQEGVVLTMHLQKPYNFSGYSTPCRNLPHL